MEALSRYAATLPPYTPYTIEEWVEMYDTMDSEDFIEKVVINHLMYVVRCTNRYVYMNIDIMDIIQAGNVGLIQAARKYDPRKGRFLTYAAFWVRSAISREIHKLMSTVPIAVNRWETYVKYLKEQINHYQKTGDMLPASAFAPQEDKEVVEDVEKLFRREVSMDTYVDDGERSTLHDLVEGGRINTMKLYVDELMECLTEEEKEILWKHYAEGKTYPQITEECDYLEGRKVEWRSLKALKKLKEKTQGENQ
jgi:RNA polymerase primary sigma factor